jgi:hypothetical protein
MKNMKSHIKLLGAFACISVLSACANPFGLQAIEKAVTSTTPFTLKAATDIVSGGSAPVVTAGGYKVTNAVGVLSTLPKVTTAGGYTVTSSVSSD